VQTAPAPAPTAPAPTVPTPPPGGETAAPVNGMCPEGQTEIDGQCSYGALACPVGNGYTLVEVRYEDPMQTYPPQPTGVVLARDLSYEEVNSLRGVHIVSASDPRCAAAAQAPSTGTIPATPLPTQGPVPGQSVPVMPGPFQGPSRAPSQVPMAPPATPAQRFSQTLRPSCKSVPYKSHMFPTTTVPLRPDAFSPREQWVR